MRVRVCVRARETYFPVQLECEAQVGRLPNAGSTHTQQSRKWQSHSASQSVHSIVLLLFIVFREGKREGGERVGVGVGGLNFFSIGYCDK